MKLGILCVMAAGLSGVALSGLLPPEKPYKILMLLPVSSRSHKNFFMPLAEALADRGHEVVMLNNHPKSSTHPNITEVTHGLLHYTEQTLDNFAYRKMGYLINFGERVTETARNFYNVKEVQELYKRRKNFDIMLVNELMNEVVLPFVDGVPFIFMGPGGGLPYTSTIMGNVVNLAYVPWPSFHLPLRSLYSRFLNMMFIRNALYWNYWRVLPDVQKELQRWFPDLPPLRELERNQSLSLLNTHFSIDVSKPLLPSQVEVGAIHCRPARPLPKDVESWITGAGPSGVIYFSLGSLTRGTSMPNEFVKLFVEVFRRLPQRVLWKYEGQLEDMPENVMTRHWLQQQDVLGHDNVKMFISHCGLLSTQESIYHAKPILALPIISDQPKNAMFVKTSGIGDMLTWDGLTVDAVINAINEILLNPKYKKNVMDMSCQLRDQLTTPQDRAVFWTEYVIRHQGAPHLRSPAADLSWVELLMLDVLAVLLVATISIFYIGFRITRMTLAWWRSRSGQKNKME